MTDQETVKSKLQTLSIKVTDSLTSAVIKKAASYGVTITDDEEKTLKSALPLDLEKAMNKLLINNPALAESHEKFAAALASELVTKGKVPKEYPGMQKVFDIAAKHAPFGLGGTVKSTIVNMLPKEFRDAMSTGENPTLLKEALATKESAPETISGRLSKNDAATPGLKNLLDLAMQAVENTKNILSQVPQGQVIALNDALNNPTNALNRGGPRDIS